MSAPAVAHLVQALAQVDAASEALAAESLRYPGAYWRARDVAVEIMALLSELGHEVRERAPASGRRPGQPACPTPAER